MNPDSPSAAAPSPAEVISYTDHLLLEILILLPAKSLARFKSVNKHWRSLISDASFRLLHLRRHRRPQTSFLLRDSRSQWSHFNPTDKNLVPFNFNFDQLKIRQSCNGLLLLECGCGYPNEVYYVYNPTTGESRNLLLPEKERILWVFLAFDPLKSPHYKVVCLRSKSMCSHYEIEVYDSETHKWKHDENTYRNMHLFLRQWVYSDNSIYILTYESGLFRFDTEKLMFQLPFFEDFGEERQLNVLCIMESFGHVHLISHDNENNLVVHEMTEKNGDWSFEHLFDFDITPWCPATSSGKISYLGVIRGEREESSLVFHIPGKIMAYRFYESRFEELLDLSTQRFCEDGSLHFGYRSSYQFVESLALV